MKASDSPLKIDLIILEILVFVYCICICGVRDRAEVAASFDLYARCELRAASVVALLL